MYVFVDDFLLVADTEELAREAGQALEDLLDEVGVCWAPHKQRGPCQVIEFLGLLISNMPDHRIIMLTEKRQKKLRGMLQEWFARRPPSGGSLRADPTELARLLGNLVLPLRFSMEDAPTCRACYLSLLAWRWTGSAVR